MIVAAPTRIASTNRWFSWIGEPRNCEQSVNRHSEDYGQTRKT